MSIRQLTAYEKNHLVKFGKNLVEIDQYGEMPVEYITGKAVFLGQVLAVSPATLIPRVETEELVERIQADISQDRTNWEGKELTGVDVGTGSGVIGVTMAQFFERQQLRYDLTMSDISSAALAVAKANFNALLPSPRFGQVEFILSDLLKSFPRKKKLDLIFANVPYIPRERLATLDSSVKDFEPLIALDGGEDGLQYISLLLKQAEVALRPGGKVYLEVDDTHTKEKFRSFTDSYGLHLLPDQFGKNRFGSFTLK